MTLLEYVQSLQEQGVKDIPAKVEEWKKLNQPEVEEEVKIDPVVETKTDATVAGKTNGASEVLNSGDSQLNTELQETEGLSNKTGGFGTPEFYDEVFNNIALDDYEKKKSQYEKELNKNNRLKASQDEGIRILESGEVNFESRIIIPVGEDSFDEYTFKQVEDAIKNKEKGFENVIDVQDYIKKVPGAEVITYTENMDFEGATGTLDEVVLYSDYDPSKLNDIFGSTIWDPLRAEQKDGLNRLEFGESSTGDFESFDDSSYYFNTTGEEKDYKPYGDKRKDNEKAINIITAQNYRSNYLTNEAALEYSNITIDDILEFGNNQLTEEELAFTKLSLEEQNEIAKDENWGEALFFGDNIINLDIAPTESELELFEKSSQLAATTEVDVLKNSLGNQYFKLVGLAKEIYNYDFRGLGDSRIEKELFKGEIIKEIATTGKLPKNLKSKLTEGSLEVIYEENSPYNAPGRPLILAFEAALKDYKAINRAILLNRDPLTVEQDGFWASAYKRTAEMLGADMDTNFEKSGAYLNWMESNGFAASKKAKENDLFIELPNGGFNLEQDFAGEAGAGAIDLTKWIGEIYLFTRGSGGFVAKSQKWLNAAATKSTNLAKIPYALGAFKSTTAVLAQSTNFTGGTLVSQYMDGRFNLEELQSSAGFGASLATGHVLYDPFVAYLRKTKMGNLFAPIVNRLTTLAPNTYNRVSRSLGTSFTGSTTYQIGGVINQGGFYDAEGNFTVSLKTQALEMTKMVMANVFTKAIPNMQTIKKEFKSDIINAVNSGRLDLASRDAATDLGLKKEDVINPNENSLKNLNDIFTTKVDDLLKRKREGKINKKDADAEFKKLKSDYRIIDTQIAVNAAYRMIKAEENSGNAPTENEFYTVSGRIKNGDKLTDRDGEVLAYYGLDAVGMLYKRLGIQKSSVNDLYLQSLIMNESRLEAKLNGKSFIMTPYGLQPINSVEFVSPKGTPARKNAREFLRKELELNQQIYRLKKLNTENLTESELLKHKENIKKQEKELEKYVPGGKLYDALQSELQGAAITALNRDIAQTDPSKGKVIEELTADSFQERYNDSGFKKEDVTRRIAFTDKDGNKVINREFALEVRDFTPVTHEIPHSILKDSFKDAEGNVTPEGIKMIDGVLKNLTPVQAKTLEQELSSRYGTFDAELQKFILPKDKKTYYEENITVLAELIKRGEINFTKSFGESLAGLVPAFKKFLPNIEVDAETGKGIFEMLRQQDLSNITIKESTSKTDINKKEAPFSLIKGEITEFNKKTAEENLKIEKEIIDIGAFKVNELEGKDREKIVKKLTDLNYGLVKKLALKAANNPNIQGLEKGKRKSYKDFEQGYALELTKIINNYEPIVMSGKNAGKRIPFGAYLAQRLKLRYGGILTDLKKGEVEASSIDTKEAKEIAAEGEAIISSEINTDFKLVDNIKVNNKPLDVSFKDKVREFATDQLENLNVTDEKFRSQAFKPSKEFINYIKQNLLGKSITDYKKFIRENPNFIKGLNIKALLEFDKGRTKEGKPRLFTELNRRLTKQEDIEKFMMQGRVSYLSVDQMGQGANLYNRLKPTETAIVNFLTGGSASTISNRKTAVAREIGNKFIAEATPSTTAFEGKTTKEKAEIAEKLQVDPMATFSEAYKKIIVKKSGMDRLNELVDQFELGSGKKWKNETTEEKTKIRQDVLVDVFSKYLPIEQFIRPTNFTSGSKISTILNRGFNMLSNIEKIIDKNPATQKRLREEAKLLIEEGVLLDLNVVKNLTAAKAKAENKEFTDGEMKAFIAAVRGKSGNAYDKNIDPAYIKLHNEGVALTLDAELKIALESPEAFAVLSEYLYNYNLNASAGRNQANAVGIEKGVKYGNKTSTDEHVFQAIEHANAKLAIYSNIVKAKALGEKNEINGKLTERDAKLIADAENSLKRYKEWLPDNYIQVGLIKANDLIKGTLTDKDGNVWKESGGTSHPVLMERLNKAIKSGKNSDWDKVPSSLIRYFNGYAHLNANNISIKGKTVAEIYNVVVAKKYQQNEEVTAEQAKIIEARILTEAGINTKEAGNAISAKEAKQRMDSFIKITPVKTNAKFSNSKTFGPKLNTAKTVEEQIEILKNYDATLENARKKDAPVKKIRVFDFDYTLGISKSNVLYEMPNGKTGKINAAEFAERAQDLEAEGAIFDFAEFNKVIDGKKGPLFDLAKKIQDARGSEDIFVLTARPQQSAVAIKEFLDALGLNLPIENITGLENGSPSAKANWIVEKAAKGYNDFYFADDAMKNVIAVKEVLDQIDVKGVVQQAKFSKAKAFDRIFNEIIESSTGIETYKEFSAAKARTIGAKKGRYSLFTTPSAEDFLGLLYKTLGKGDKGNAQLDFYNKNLIDTYNRAELSVTEAKITASKSFKALKSKLTTLPKSLSKETGIGGFTFSQAVRVSAWTKQGMKIPGLSKADVRDLNKFVDENAELTTFTDQLIQIQKGKPYPAPSKEWLAGTITTDIIGEINKVNRKDYLQEWQENVDILFSEKNLNKLEAAYGSKYREALEESLYRMKTGSNRPVGGSRIVNEMMDWLNNSVGAIMFLNTRSAVLQTISSVNFINWENNNILKAGKAFANQPQYWKDFKTLMDSPYLLERREGLKINVSESEIADAVMQSKNKVSGAINYLLNKGFVFTRIADSFAIASGGSTFYRNQIEAYMKAGRTKEDAEKLAYEDFYAIAETNQQSSNPSKISQQQASAAGRVILAFGNTPMQYNRIIKKSTQDLVAGRGDWKANLTKIVYYAGMQNFIFNALQNALFAEAFGEDEGEESTTMANRQARIADGMSDSLLRGMGIQGAGISAVKDALITIYKENSKEKGTPKYEKAIDDLLGFSPPISSKIRKVRGGLRTLSWNQKQIDKEGFNLNNPAYLAGADIVEGFTNVPTGRAIKKMNNIRNIFSDNSQAWQKVALTMGWSSWDVGLPYYGVDGEGNKQTPAKVFESKTDELKKTTTSKQQKQTLLDLGVTRSELKKYKYEEDRIRKILELQKKYKNNPKTKDSLVKVNKRKTVIFAQNKPAQVAALLKLGLSKADIKKLKYEKNRVDKIIELQNKK